jgi:hypothetical protein
MQQIIMKLVIGAILILGNIPAPKFDTANNSEA